MPQRGLSKLARSADALPIGMSELPYARPPASGMRVRPDFGGFSALLYPRWRLRPRFVATLLAWETLCVGGLTALAWVGYLPSNMGGGGLGVTLGFFLLLALGFFEVRTFLPVEVGVALPHLVWDGDRVPLMGVRCVGDGGTARIVNVDGALRYELVNLRPEVVSWLKQTIDGYQDGVREDEE